jgi:hypothetical protein
MGPRLRALVFLAGFCGLRPGELLGLERRDIDLLHRVVHVRRQAHEITGQGRVLSLHRRPTPATAPSHCLQSWPRKWTSTSTLTWRATPGELASLSDRSARSPEIDFGEALDGEVHLRARRLAIRRELGSSTPGGKNVGNRSRTRPRLSRRQGVRHVMRGHLAKNLHVSVPARSWGMRDRPVRANTGRPVPALNPQTTLEPA